MNNATVARQLVVNTLVSGAGIFWITVFGLIVIPLIIATWGVAALGLIVLARLLLPAGALALIDLGVSEVTTQVVARTRVSGDWDEAAKRISFLFVLAGGIGLLIAAGLWLAAPAVTRLFDVPPQHQQSFQCIVRISALANLVLMPALVCEGIIKGFEKYTVVRGFDVAANAGYLIGTLAASALATSYAVVAIIYIAAMVLKGMVSIAIAGYALRGKKCSPLSLPITASREDLHRCWLMLEGRLISSALGPGLPLAVGALFGPHSVGIYDSVTRLPRASKILSSLLTSAVLPVASRLEQGGQGMTLRLLAFTGIVILPALTIPPLAGSALLGTEILKLWIGPTLAVYGPWMALCFLIPIVLQAVSFGSTLLLTRRTAQAKLNRLAALQIPIIIAVTALVHTGLQERALMLAQVIATLAIYPLQMRVLLGGLDLDMAETSKTLVVQFVLLAVLWILFHYALKNATLGIVTGALTFVGWCVTAWVLQYALVFTSKERDVLRDLTRVTLGAMRSRPANP